MGTLNDPCASAQVAPKYQQTKMLTNKEVFFSNDSIEIN